MGDIGSLRDDQLLREWDTTLEFIRRDEIVEELKKRELFPKLAMAQWEAETGAYPLFEDPEFLQKLLAKREFAETLQTTWKPTSDPCGDESTFEVTPVQRFVATLMSPKSPYMSALLYHGVGVGKTCAAVQITEAWLEAYPRDKVIMITPPTIQQGFYRTIFDSDRIKFGDEEGTPNQAVGCTGDRYMKLTGTLLERDKARIQKKVSHAIRRRYSYFGYISFANHVRDMLKKIPADKSDEDRAKLEATILRREFSGKLLVVDEAHNLRDLPDEMADEEASGDKTDAAAGKQLTPFLRKVLTSAEGLKLVLLTATPMYNSYREIIFILNLLLMNDKKALLSESDIFTRDGDFRGDKAKEKLGAIARHYVSFMRGENPKSFPIRLMPQDVPKLSQESYPTVNPRGAPVNSADTIFINHLPIIPIPLIGETLKASIAFMNDLPPITGGTGGLSSIVLEKLVHAGNFIVPAVEETEGDTLAAYKSRTDINGLGTIFNKETIGGEVRYTAKIKGGSRWLGADQLAPYSSKFVFLLEKLRRAEGVEFVYTRFVSAGALPLALALEANGYTPVGRRRGLLGDGIQTPGGRQCALCENREDAHRRGLGHDFSPAYYGLLTGDITLSPRNEDIIRLERDPANVNGLKMKIIIGSQIAAEGVDLRFVREIHVLDSWFHLNKTEQILGRGIRFCSHSALPEEKRNTTIYLYAATLPIDKESADLYSYRMAYKKAVQMGRVSRALKESAIDCNLNHDAILISGQEPVRQIDSQRVERLTVSINDMPFTAICDWTECPYDCKPTIAVNPGGTDDSTYSEFASRWRENSLKEQLRALFAIQVSYKGENLIEMLDIPQANIADLLLSVIDNRLFQVTHKGVDGYIRYCNKYFIFQPNMYGDLAIPMSLRVAKIPMKRDEYNPVIRDYVENIIEDEVVVSSESVGEAWDGFVEWCTAVAGSKSPVAVPTEIYTKMRSMSKGDTDIEGTLKMSLDMVNWFQRAFQSSSDDRELDQMRNVLLEFFWDHWFSLDEQKTLLTGGGIRGSHAMINDTIYTLGRIKVVRFVNSDNGSLVYMCKDGKLCDDSIVRAINEDKREPIKNVDLTGRTMGELYGFIVPKYGNVVFKTNEPVKMLGAVPGVGVECANVSTVATHFKKLYKLGTILKASGKTDFQLNETALRSTYKVISAGRVCCLFELVLRYMDKIRIQNRRWFLRPVSAYYSGHIGRFRVVSKSAKK